MSARALVRRAWPVLALLALLAQPARAHEGPPYAIVMDRDVGGWSLSIWTDPDIGDSRFFLLFDEPEREDAPRPAEVRAVSLYVQPSDRSAPEHRYDGAPAERSAGPRFDVDTYFPAGGFYRVRHVIDTAAGVVEIVEEVEATPPGFGRLDLLWYLAPFAAVAFLWVRALLAKRQLAAGSVASSERPPSPP